VGELTYLLGLDMVKAALFLAAVLASLYWAAFVLRG